MAIKLILKNTFELRVSGTCSVCMYSVASESKLEVNKDDTKIETD
jgi:hypothetical protein